MQNEEDLLLISLIKVQSSTSEVKGKHVEREAPPSSGDLRVIGSGGGGRPGARGLFSAGAVLGAGGGCSY